MGPSAAITFAAYDRMNECLQWAGHQKQLLMDHAEENAKLDEVQVCDRDDLECEQYVHTRSHRTDKDDPNFTISQHK